jgi:ABC-type bacteriocin/lantibiotic exporter with double-glycine peptidase domain
MAIDDNLRAMIFDWGVIQSSMDLIAKPLKRKNVSKNSPQPVPTQKAGIGMNNVYFKYPNASTYNLEDISLHINHGEKVAIVGEIGCGKSTILKLLMNYYTQTKGVVYYDGVPFHQISLQQIRKSIGYVPQVPILFNRSIIENIMYGNPNVSRKQVEDLLKEIDMYDELTMKDKGLDTIVGKNGSNLSGGQRQLVWVMRVILSEPETIIFDEPTSSMDAKSKKRLRYLLDKYFQNKTVIMVSHDPSILSFAKRILTIENGKVKQENNSFF